MKFVIDFCNGFEEVIEANDIYEAQAAADDMAGYTQTNIEIYEDDDDEPTCMRIWYGVAYDEEEDDCESPICFGEFGFYGDWVG